MYSLKLIETSGVTKKKALSSLGMYTKALGQRN